jgi:hypothetical protein
MFGFGLFSDSVSTLDTIRHRKTWKGNVFRMLNWAPCHEDLCMGHGGMAPLNTNLGATCWWVISFTFRPCYLRTGGWVGPEPVCTPQCRIDKRMNVWAESWQGRRAASDVGTGTPLLYQRPADNIIVMNVIPCYYCWSRKVSQVTKFSKLPAVWLNCCTRAAVFNQTLSHEECLERVTL